jgi:tetratricopeptide (TPR) repeat protein
MIKQHTYRLVMFFACLCAFGGMRAQQNPDFVEAYKYIQLNQVDSARARIDKALKDSALTKDPQSWYVKGYIYKVYYKIKEANNRNSPARQEAVNSFFKAISLTADTGRQLRSDCKVNLKYLAARFYNDAAQALDTSNYNAPIQYFGQYLAIMKKIEPDMSTVKMEVEFSMALATTYTSLYQANQKTRANFLELAKAALAKVLTLDPNNVSANYNLGTLYYNQAVYLIRGQDYDIDLTSMDAIQDNQVQLFKQSLPFAEKAYALDPKKEEALLELSGIYFGLNDFEKSKLFQEKLDQLKKEQQKQH